MSKQEVVCIATGLLLGLLAGPSLADGQTVAEVLPRMGPCQSHLVDALSDQLLRAHLCSFPETLVRFEHRNIDRNPGAAPYGTPEMVAALYRAADGGGLHVNSAFRTLVVQHAYRETDRPGNGDGCWGPASPGESRHEWGNAVDLANAAAVAPRMRAAGFTWWGPDGIGPEYDDVHFTAGPERRGDGVRAFQHLWNVNHPEDLIEEDGAWGPNTRARLNASPAGGFPDDGCAPPCDGTGDDDACAIELLLKQPSAYSGPTSTDVNADGRADMCARGAAGVRCWTARAGGWDEEWAPIPWSDDSGWNDVTNYATLRMGDVNGDGRADVCGRSNNDFLCALSSGDGFDDATPWRPEMSDDSGWAGPRYYTTIRLADVNGDGRDDLCARDSEGFDCWLSDGAAFDEHVEGPRWSNAGFGLAKYYGTLRMGDLNGDGRADACIRGEGGMECVLSDAGGFGATIEGPAWDDARGFSAMQFWSTIRLADVTGDGLSDLCTRTSTDLRCVVGTAAGFGETLIVSELSDESGWGDVTNYASLRTGDIDGDGGADLCLRSNNRVGCWVWDGAEFMRRDGPEWSDAMGWDTSDRYQTIRVADVDGDGLEDLCGRGETGWRCYPSLGDSFGEALTLDDLDDASGWSAPQYYTTILSAGSACGDTELCNGVDDDCDGMVDESCPVGGDSSVGPIDGGADGGVNGDIGPGGPMESGCSCSAAGAPPRAPRALLLLGLMALGLTWRVRRRRGIARA